MGNDLKGKSLGKGISQRKDGRYEARAVINGVKISLYNMNLSQIRKDFEIEKARVLRNEKSNRSNMRLDEWFNEWFPVCKEPKLKGGEATKVYLRKIRNTYIRILGKKEIEKISPFNIQEATTQLEVEGYSYRNIREALSVLRDCFDSAIMNRMILINPCKDIFIKQANIAPKEKRVLQKWEQDLFLSVAKNGVYYELYQFLLLTGLRIGELSALTWEDIDFAKKTISISKSLKTYWDEGEKIQKLSTPKSVNGYRTIPFFGNVEEILYAWGKKQQEIKSLAGAMWKPEQNYGNLVFTTTIGTPITRYNIIHDIGRIKKDMDLIEIKSAFQENRLPREIKKISPHAFRHTFCTICFKKKLDPVFVQRIMGHANYETTLYYTHLVEDVISEEINKTKNFLD